MSTEQINQIKKISLFSDMDEQEISDLLTVMSQSHFVPGQIIIREGDEGDLFHVITEGTAQFITFDAEGNELILDEAGPGEYFGELSMLTGEQRSLRVRAQDTVKTLDLHRDQFHQFLLKHPHAAIDILTVLGRRLSRTDNMLRKSISRNLNEVLQENITVGQKIADGFATVMGSWPFIIVQSCILTVWVTLNIVGWVYRWDPYPFILLNLALSFQAAYAAPIIMMSQNRQSDKDRLAAEIDHEVNVKAEIKVSVIMSRLDDIEKGMHFLHQEQLSLLKSKV